MTLHHYLREVDGRPARYHLRVEADGAGLLLANAAAAVKLSPSGVAIARRLLEGAGALDVADEIAREFRGASRGRVEEDVARVEETLEELATRADLHPLRDIDHPEASVYRRTLSAPLTAEVVGGDGSRVDDVLRALWDAGVPQVLFPIADAGARERATGWVERAEDLGMIAGVRGRASVLGRLGDLADAGLDHVDVLFAGADAEAHDRLGGDGDFAAALALFEEARELEVFPVAWVPLLAGSFENLDEIAAAAAARGVRAMTLAPLASDDSEEDGALAARALPQAAALAEEVAERLGAAIVWAPAVERDAALPLAEQVRRGPRASGEAAVRVEADGAVIPPTGSETPAGNLLEDRWEVIWGRERFRAFREASENPPRCETCPGLAACAIGCPLERSTWALTGASGGGKT